MQKKEPTLRVTTRPNDANLKGDIFGGWLMSQIDIAGAIAAVSATKGAIATVAVKELQFIKPLYPHDVVSFYTDIVSIGNTSVTVAIEVHAQRHLDLENSSEKVANAVFVYVAVENPGVKRQIKKD